MRGLLETHVKGGGVGEYGGVDLAAEFDGEGEEVGGWHCVYEGIWTRMGVTFYGR